MGIVTVSAESIRHDSLPYRLGKGLAFFKSPPGICVYDQTR
jgi:hypothetical protein